jgi:hypothetical protein
MEKAAAVLLLDLFLAKLWGDALLIRGYCYDIRKYT